jgi:excisionase family DNA binding protein
MAKSPAVVEQWLSLEQVAAALEVPWATVYRWARDGDPCLPAYKVWDEGDSKQGRFRFKKQDVEAFQALQPPVVPAALSS